MCLGSGIDIAKRITDMVRHKTISETVEFKGTGIHTGEPAHIRLHPAEEDRGIIFLKNGVYIPASPEFVVNTSHSIDLKKQDSLVKTIEHMMATLHLLGITNLLIEVVEGNEIPILDGSGYLFYLELKDKIIEQSSGVEPFKVYEPVKIKMGSSYIEAMPCSCFEITYEGEFETYLGRQRYTFNGNIKDIIKARTFCFDHEIDVIKSKGLGRGGSLKNTLVIGKEGIYNEGGLRYEDEHVRHKVLDLIGDIYLLGAPFQGKIKSYKGGHSLNYKLVKELMKSRVGV